jgi:OFA family oxalate/formate antiporter-like MFS transporter
MANDNLEGKRWFLALAGMVIMLVLGTVYAWSVFVKPIAAAHGWEVKVVSRVFMLIIGVIGISAAFGGMLVDKKGPKFVATLGTTFYGVGILLGGLALYSGNFMFLLFGYGVIAGIGNGLAYVVPIATLIRWFPDKRGLITGLAVMGFGFGAFFIGLLAPGLVNKVGVANAFLTLGVIYLVCSVLASLTLKNPPDGWLPKGFKPTATAVCAADSFNWSEASKTRQWYMLWGMLFLNVTAGMGLLSKLSPMAQDVIKLAQNVNDPAKLAVLGGGVLATASIFNGLGRLFWATISDMIGRKEAYMVMFLTQAILYIYLPQTSSVLLFTIIACYLLSCLGGGFAVMPAFTADSFGPENIGRIYGFLLTAWGAAGVVGGFVFAEFNKQQSLITAAICLSIGFAIALLFTAPKKA